MKYGIILHKTTMNLGDDIQSYAAAKLLPSVDYVVERENIDAFSSKDNESVGVIMSAWWMWSKWNWPPAECIVPKMLSMHINNYSIYRKGTPITTEWVTGIGGEYFKANGPVGCRDNSSIEFFKENGIDSYFSGCITLTLPKQKKTADAGSYVCLVDLRPELKNKAKEYLADTGLEIREMTHHCDYRKSDDSLEKRFDRVEETLTQYQNAKLVITRRLHVALPCLAMGTPVLCLVNMKDVGNATRWHPYTDWVHSIAEKDFINGNFSFDFANPPENKPNYLETRESLINEINKFIDETKDVDLPIEKIKKTTFTEQEAREWQFGVMRSTLDKWLHQNRGLLAKKDTAEKLNKKYEKAINDPEFIKKVKNSSVNTDKMNSQIKSSLYNIAKKAYHKLTDKRS